MAKKYDRYDKTNKSANSMSEIFRESGIYSINRVFPGILFFLSNFGFWTIVCCIFFFGYAFNAFGELTTVYISMQTLIASWLTGNKFTNSKYNTEPGTVGKPIYRDDYYSNNSVINTTSSSRKPISAVGTTDRDAG